MPELTKSAILKTKDSNGNTVINHPETGESDVKMGPTNTLADWNMKISTDSVSGDTVFEFGATS